MEVRPIVHNFQGSNDYSTIVNQSDIMDNLRVIVNNVGVLKLNGDLEMKPEDLQAQIIVNMYPITLMSKYAKLAFMKQSDKDPLRQNGDRYAMV